MIATALSKPSIKAIFFNKVSVLEEIFDGSYSRKTEFIKLFIDLEFFFIFKNDVCQIIL